MDETYAKQNRNRKRSEKRQRENGGEEEDKKETPFGEAGGSRDERSFGAKNQSIRCASKRFTG